MPPRDRGTILIVTMWIVLVLAGLVLVLARSMRVEAMCSANNLASLQADAIEQAAIQYVLAHTDSLQGEMPTDTDTPCEAVRVGNGAFWIVKPDFDNDRACAYGLVDEASKLNVNTASLSMLQLLPDMTDELAASIRDWVDADSDVTAGGGAENDYYSLLDNPYQCKNSPMETVEEMLLVKGCTPEILFGEDTNRNFVLDANEDDADDSDPLDNRDGVLDRGLLPYVTVYSREPNTAADGASRVNVGDLTTNSPGPANLKKLDTMLTNRLPSKKAAVDRAIQAVRPRRFTSVFDFYFRLCKPPPVSMTPTEFALIADYITTSTTAPRGLINMRTAPRDVLTCLGLTQTEAEGVIGKRGGFGQDMTTVAWLIDTIPQAKLIALSNLITTRSFQFCADIVSVAENGRAFRRCRVIVDARSSPPKVQYRQDVTHLGWPLDAAILDQLRQGVPVEQLTSTQSGLQEIRK